MTYYANCVCQCRELCTVSKQGELITGKLKNFEISIFGM